LYFWTFSGFIIKYDFVLIDQRLLLLALTVCRILLAKGRLKHSRLKCGPDCRVTVIPAANGYHVSVTNKKTKSGGNTKPVMLAMQRNQPARYFVEQNQEHRRKRWVTF
jgi:hypothetical protein